MVIEDGFVELYWDDLTEETSNSLLDLWNENGNYDIVPIVRLPIDPNDFE